MTARDVTERQRDGRALRQSEARFWQMLTGIDQAAFALDRDARVTFVNAALRRLTGWTTKELIGRDWFATCLPEEVRPFGWAMFEECVAARDFSRRSTSEHRSTSEVVTRSVERRVVALVETDRTRIPAAVEQSTDAVLLVEPKETIVYANEAFERLSGYSRQELLVRTTIVLDGPDVISVPRQTWLRIVADRAYRGPRSLAGRRDRPRHAPSSPSSPSRRRAGTGMAFATVYRHRQAVRRLDLGALPAVRVLYVSGFAEDSLIDEGVAGKGTAFLPQPFSAEALAQAVRRVLGDGDP